MSEFRIYQRAASRVYQVDFNVGGQRYQKSTGETDRIKAQQAAQAIYDQARREYASGKDQFVNEAGYTHLVKYINHLKEIGRSKSTVGNAHRFYCRLLEFYGNRIPPLTEIKQEDIRKWSLWLSSQKCGKRKGNLSPKTVAEHINWLSAAYNFYQLPSPCHNVERPKVSQSEEVNNRKIYTVEEIKAQLAKADELATTDNEWKEFRSWLYLFCHTGCRYDELMSLSLDRINEKDHSIRVIGKGSTTRTLSFTNGFSKCWEHLQILVEAAKAHYGEEMKPNNIICTRYKNWFRNTLRFRFCEPFQMEYKGVHAYRHFFATTALAKNGWSISVLAKHLGHDQQVCWRIYYHHIPTSLPEFSF